MSAATTVTISKLRAYRARALGVAAILRSMFQHSSEVGGIDDVAPGTLSSIFKQAGLKK